MEYCKNHPDHKQLKGVCPFCLRDQLSKLDYAPTVVLFSNKFTTSVSNSASASSSTCDSPVLCRGGTGRRRSRHNRSDMLSSMSLKLSRIANHRDENNNNRLKKSKSITFISSKKNISVGDQVKNVTNNNKKLKKDGFWSKFINSSKGNNSSSFNSRRDQVLIQHPKTVSLRLF